MEINVAYMARALQLARGGMGHVSPNPMVGAVIVHNGQVIGEGWHRRYGGPHAEVRAVESVADEGLLADSTMYVTLEPCSHYGKTPPCAKLIIDKKIPRVVVATLDPFVKVSGRGVAMLRDAGVEVEVGLMEREARELNRRFFTAHTLGRPYVMLKWAQSADGYLDARREEENAEPLKFSTPLTLAMMHAERSRYDAIMVGAGTVMADNPSLSVRLVAGEQPLKVVVDRRGSVAAESAVFACEGIIYCGPQRDDIRCKSIVYDYGKPLGTLLSELYGMGITSLMVEGGATLITSFENEDLWDECRVEISPIKLGTKGVARVEMPRGIVVSEIDIDGRKIVNIRKNNL